MHEASFTSFLKTLFYIVLFYYLFKIVVRMLFPVVVRTAARKAEESLRQQFGQQQRQRQEYASRQPETPKPRETKIVGEYVDFEEIE